MGYNNIYLALEGQILGQSSMAVKFQFTDIEAGKSRVEWFPLSQVASMHHLYNEEAGTLDVIMASEWILKQKNAKHLASTKRPNLPAARPAPLETKLTSPPAKSFVDMDDDMPF